MLHAARLSGQSESERHGLEAELTAWERRMQLNAVLDPMPVRVDARMRPVTVEARRSDYHLCRVENDSALPSVQLHSRQRPTATARSGARRVAVVTFDVTQPGHISLWGGKDGPSP
jgi:hypothetical protein